MIIYYRNKLWFCESNSNIYFCWNFIIELVFIFIQWPTDRVYSNYAGLGPQVTVVSSAIDYITETVIARNVKILLLIV